jgi:hypothetical protein
VADRAGAGAGAFPSVPRFSGRVRVVSLSLTRVRAPSDFDAQTNGVSASGHGKKAEDTAGGC